MKVTKVLINKYHLGACNDQENALIENWLQGGREDTLPHFPAHVIAYRIEDRIWERLKKNTINKIFLTHWLIGIVAFAFILWLITCLPREIK